MNEEKIIKSEVDLLSAAIERIVSSEVLQSVMSEQLPLTSDLTDSNKIYRGKVSVLFVDMRESTKLPEKFNAAQLVKIYRSYIRTVVQAIRYSGGVVRDFMGDGVLAVFVDNADGKSEVYINPIRCMTYIDAITTATLLCIKSEKRALILYHIPLKENAIRNKILLTNGFSRYILLMERISRPSNIHNTKR